MTTPNNKINAPFTLKVFEWIKGNWILLLVIIVIIISYGWAQGLIAGVRGQNVALQKMLTSQHNEHVRDIAELSSSFEREREEQRRIQQAFDERIAQLNQEYIDTLSKIRTNTSIRRRRLENNPSELPNAIEQTFGIPPGESRP